MTVDIATGATTTIGSPLNCADSIRIRDLAYDDTSQTLYGYDSLQNRLVTIDPQTGIGTMTPIYGTSLSLAIDAEGVMYSYDSGYLTRYDSSEERFLRVGSTSITGFNFLSADKSTGTLYSTISNKLYSLDTTSGAAALIATMSSRDKSIGYRVAVFSALAFDNLNDTL